MFRGWEAWIECCDHGEPSIRLGSVSDYCIRHCVCPVVVVRYPEESNGGGVKGNDSVGVSEKVELHPVPEEEHEEYHDANDEQKGLLFKSSTFNRFLYLFAYKIYFQLWSTDTDSCYYI